MEAPRGALPPISISLPGLYLCERYDDEASRLLYQAFGAPGACLERLRAQDVAAVEVRYSHKSLRPKDIRGAIDRLRALGLGISIHGELSSGAPRQNLFRSFPWVEHLLDCVPRRRDPLVCTLHPLESVGVGPRDSRARTLQALHGLADQAGRQGLPIEFALELMRAKAAHRTAVTYEEVLSIVQTLDHPRVGICWDMGHGYANIRRGLMALAAPESFARRVIHTHIHGLSPKGRTHWFLNGANLPLALFVSTLVRSGYGGVYNLELSPERFAGIGDLAELVTKSVLVLRRNLQSSSSEPPAGASPRAV
jgi:sugar phosphate isomerase/epimerase